MKDFNIENIIRKNIKSMKPYSSARDEYQDLNDDYIFLDANENPIQNGINRYPDPNQKVLKQEISTIKNINKDQILLGNGSDEVLDLLFRAFCEPNIDNVITLPPTYGMYGVLANLNAIENREIPLNLDFEPQIDKIFETLDSNTKLIFICSPNNPTGNSFNKNLILNLLNNFNGLVVLDEAYIDFSENISWLNEIKNYENLVVIQTLSKAYGMAGIRLGMLFASSKIINILHKIKPPYNINVLTQNAALSLLKNKETVQKDVVEILKQKEFVCENLLKATFVEKIYKSDTNFVLIKVDDANFRYKQFLENGFVIRNRTKDLLCQNCLRITIGTATENQKLIQFIKTL